MLYGLESKESSLTSYDIKSPFFISNMIQLLTYLDVWSHMKEDNNELYLSSCEMEIFIAIDALFSIFHKLELLYSTLPDQRINAKKTEAKDILPRMEKNILYKNGGIFFSFVHILSDMFCHFKKPDYKSPTLGLLTNLLSGVTKQLKRQQSKEIIIDSKPGSPSHSKSSGIFEVNLLERIGKSNENLLKIFKNHNSEGYFEPIIKKKKNYSLNPSVKFFFILPVFKSFREGQFTAIFYTFY